MYKYASKSQFSGLYVLQEGAESNIPNKFYNNRDIR